MRFQVGTRAERLVAGSGEDRNSDIRIVAEMCPRREQQLVRLGVDGVVGLGPVQRDVRDLTALFVDHLGHGIPSRARDPAVKCGPIFKPTVADVQVMPIAKIKDKLNETIHALLTDQAWR
jgi:hypothetical protein